MSGVSAIAASTETSCAVVADHQVRCWGRGTEYQIGGDGAFDAERARRVLNSLGTGPLVDAVQVVVGRFHACARTSGGTAWCWGQNAYGQLGEGTTDLRLRPVEVRNGLGNGPLTGIAQLAAGASHTCARLVDGRVACWGRNNQGQLGDDTLTRHELPNLVRDGDGIGPLEDVAQIAAGRWHTCARRAGGQVRCWGDDEVGQLGNGPAGDSRLPTAVLRPSGVGALGDIAQIALGDEHTCARLGSGQARCWGWNHDGALGDGTDHDRPLPVGVQRPAGGPLTGIAQVATGTEDHSCFRLASRRLRCTGSNDFGLLGRPSVGERSLVPVLVRNGSDTGPLGGVAQVVAGDDFTCARLVVGQARCWGSNSRHHLGDGTSDHSPLPRPVYAQAVV
jgi:alpha-tubulin suppressor-like RCC1 family protein